MSTAAGSGNDATAGHTPTAPVFLRRYVVVFFLLASLVIVYGSSFFPSSYTSLPSIASSSLRDLFFPPKYAEAENEEYKLERVLKNAATIDKTVILTTLNEAWAAPDSIFDIFLESFKIGNDTRQLLNHLVVIALDAKALSRCLLVHTHCFYLVTQGTHFSAEAHFMSPDYLKMMRRRIDFLRSVLEMGYNFVFTDTDIMWLRNPFQWFYPETDFQIACDHFNGNSYDRRNNPNGGFVYVRSSNRSIAFYRFWHSSQYKFPGHHDQAVLHFIKNDPFLSEIGLRMRFLDTSYFSGLCEASRDLNLVCTMHVNCCVGMYTKIHDLRLMLQDWREYMSLMPTLRNSSAAHPWRALKNSSCLMCESSKPARQCSRL